MSIIASTVFTHHAMLPTQCMPQGKTLEPQHPAYLKRKFCRRSILQVLFKLEEAVFLSMEFFVVTNHILN